MRWAETEAAFAQVDNNTETKAQEEIYRGAEICTQQTKVFEDIKDLKNCAVPGEIKKYNNKTLKQFGIHKKLVNAIRLILTDLNIAVKVQGQP
jgi:hypothetical protein